MQVILTNRAKTLNGYWLMDAPPPIRRLKEKPAPKNAPNLRLLMSCFFPQFISRHFHIPQDVSQNLLVYCFAGVEWNGDALAFHVFIDVMATAGTRKAKAAPECG
jgi:hypothetical protein